MKRIFILCAALVAMTAVAQDEPAAPEQKPAGAWTTTTTPALKLSEFMFNNSSKSGNSQIDLTATFFGNYKYTHPKYIWDNVVDLAYGFAWQDLDNSDTAGGLFETRRKSNDKIDITSAISWKPFSKLPDWGANFTANLKTQFGEGREYTGIEDKVGTPVSNFFAPAYLTTALSFEYKKPDWSVSFSFLTGKTTFVCIDSFIVKGLDYGVIQDDGFDPADPATYSKIKHSYFALGSYIKAQYLKKDIVKNLDLYARLELFYDYQKPKNMSWDDLDKSKYTGIEMATPEGRQRLADMSAMQRFFFETDLDFEVKLDYRFSEHIAANFALNLKYDTDFSGMGWGGHWQLYQMAGIQVFFNWKTPKS